MKTKFLVLVLSLLFQCISSLVNAQQSTFAKVYYDLAGAVQSYAMVRTFDQNYMIAGEKDSQALAMKIDPSGNILWGKMFGGWTGSRFNSLATTTIPVLCWPDEHHTTTIGQPMFFVSG